MNKSDGRGPVQGVTPVKVGGFLEGSHALLSKELPTHDTPSPGDFPQPLEEPTQGSTLARYIHRFRYGEPKSRSRRAIEQLLRTERPLSPPSDFWWLSSNSAQGSSTPQEKGGKLHGPDWGIEDLQRRAGELIDRSESSSNNVSGETEESSADSSHSHLPRIKHHHQTPTHQRDKENADCGGGGGGGWKESEPRPARLSPENDILYQWRLRRKMEQAQGRAVLLSLSNQPSRLPSPTKTRLEDPDSKLAEFRSRLLGRAAREESLEGRGTLISGSGRPSLDKDQGVDPSSPPATTSTKNQGVDPMPQSRSTQTSPVEETLSQPPTTTTEDTQSTSFQRPSQPDRKEDGVGWPLAEDSSATHGYHRQGAVPGDVVLAGVSGRSSLGSRPLPGDSLTPPHVRRLTFPDAGAGAGASGESWHPCSEEAIQPSPVTRAIHQIVADRLFSTPVIDGPEVDHSYHEFPEKNSGSILPSSSSERETCDSDDELLQMLIAKRTMYQKQLEKIDLLLVNSQRHHSSGINPIC